MRDKPREHERQTRQAFLFYCRGTRTPPPTNTALCPRLAVPILRDTK